LEQNVPLPQQGWAKEEKGTASKIITKLPGPSAGSRARGCTGTVNECTRKKT